MPDHVTGNSPEKAKLHAAVDDLQPDDQAVLIVVQAAKTDPSYSLELFGMEREQWPAVLGVISSGLAYTQSEMFLPAQDESD